MNKLYLIPLIAFAFISAGCSSGTVGKITQPDKYFDLDNPTQGCTIKKTCGDLVSVDCGVASDGPFYYVDKTNNKIISNCGGFRMMGENTDVCPPESWTCN